MLENERGPLLPPEPQKPLQVNEGLLIPARLGVGMTSQQFRGGSNQNLTRRMIAFDVLSNVIDFLVVTAILLMTISACGFFHFIDQSMMPSRQLLGVILMSAFQITKICTRIFYSQTLGDWACGLRVIVLNPGSQQSFRAFRILLRSVLNIVTGFLFLPLLSFYRNEDLAGRISKAYLFKF